MRGMKMRTRPGLKAAGLCVLVTAVLAIGTPGIAQAETGACWGYLEGASLKCFSASLEAKPEVALENATIILLIANFPAEFLCTKVLIIGTLGPDGRILPFIVIGHGCIALTHVGLMPIPTCTPNDPVEGKGSIRTEKLEGLITLHSGQPTVVVKPTVGTTLAKIFLGEECSVGEEIIVGGKFVFQDSGGKTAFEEHKLTHLIQEFTSLQLMKVGVNKATLLGTANATLASPHNALKWGGKAA